MQQHRHNDLARHRGRDNAAAVHWSGNDSLRLHYSFPFHRERFDSASTGRTLSRMHQMLKNALSRIQKSCPAMAACERLPSASAVDERERLPFARTTAEIDPRRIKPPGRAEEWPVKNCRCKKAGHPSELGPGFFCSLMQGRSGRTGGLGKFICSTTARARGAGILLALFSLFVAHGKGRFGHVGMRVGWCWW